MLSPSRPNLFANEAPLKESAFQRTLVKMLQTSLRPDVVMRHITSGGADARTGAKLKQLGRMAGCADLEFIWLDVNRHTQILFLELKMPGRKQSPSQIEFMDRVTPFGLYCVVTTIEEAMAALTVCGLLKPASVH